MRSTSLKRLVGAFILTGVVFAGNLTFSMAEPASASAFDPKVAPPLVPPVSPAPTPSLTYVEGSDPAATLYNPLVVNQIDFTMPATTIAGLTSPNVNSDAEGPYLPASMTATVNGKVYGPLAVGVHLKGAWGSWRDINGKSGFKVKINFVDKNARFFGVSKLTLNNMVQDPSFLHETMAYRIFRAVGIASPRTGFANVSVNGTNYGLHLNLETLDTNLLSRFKVSPKHIYKAGVPYFADLAAGQEAGFVIDYGKADDISDLEALIEANSADPQVDWFAKVSQVADLKEMTLDWATELFTGHWDGYVHNRNNYYLVSDSTGRFIMLPWGTDQTFYGGVDYFSNEGLLFTNCLASKPCLLLYQQALAKVVHTANALNMVPMTRSVADAISAAAMADDRKEFGNEVIPGYQDGARNTFLSQVTNALLTFASFDTELKAFGDWANGYVGVNQTLYVPSTTKSIALQGSTYTPNAAAIPAQINLHDGLNTATVMVQNKVGGNTQLFAVKVYRLSSKTLSVKVDFAPGSKSLTLNALKSLTSLGIRLANCKDVTIELLFAQGPKSYKTSIALAKRRANELSAKLSAVSIKPIKITYGLSPKVSGNQALINLKYQG